MRKILTLTMSGLVTVLPLALTVYVIWWLVQTVEGWLRRALIGLGIVSPQHYWPGLGLITGFFLLLVVGSLVNAYAGKIANRYLRNPEMREKTVIRSVATSSAIEGIRAPFGRRVAQTGAGSKSRLKRRKS